MSENLPASVLSRLRAENLRTFLLPIVLPGPVFSKWTPNKGWS